YAAAVRAIHRLGSARVDTAVHQVHVNLTGAGEQHCVEVGDGRSRARQAGTGEPIDTTQGFHSFSLDAGSRVSSLMSAIDCPCPVSERQRTLRSCLRKRHTLTWKGAISCSAKRLPDA